MINQGNNISSKRTIYQTRRQSNKQTSAKQVPGSAKNLMVTVPES
jgi:hypothetical protein